MNINLSNLILDDFYVFTIFKDTSFMFRSMKIETISLYKEGKNLFFFFITNDCSLAQHEVVAEGHERCDQENTIEQLKNGARALHAPLNTLKANWAYMVIASLAWTLKAWFALLLPVSPRWRERHEHDQQLVLRMDFRSFLQQLILIPAQIIRRGRRLAMSTI